MNTEDHNSVPTKRKSPRELLDDLINLFPDTMGVSQSELIASTTLSVLIEISFKLEELEEAGHIQQNTLDTQHKTINLLVGRNEMLLEMNKSLRERIENLERGF